MTDRYFFRFGYFVNDGKFVSVQDPDRPTIARPKVRKALDPNELRMSAIALCNGDEKRVDSWNVSFDCEAIVFAEFSDPMAITWAIQLVISQRMDIVDGTLRIVPLDELQSMSAD